MHCEIHNVFCPKNFCQQCSDEFDKVSSFDNSIDYIYSEIKLIRKICDKMENELINLKIEQEKKK